MNKALVISLLLLSSLTLSGCTTTPNSTGDVGSVQNSTEMESVDFEVIASHLKYSPNRIEVNPGETIKIRVFSQDEVHDLVIDELNVDTGLIGAGRSTVVTIQIPQDASGKTFEFYCSVGSHRAMGMVGDLIVR